MAQAGTHYITEWRRYRRLSKTDLAEKIGVSKSTVYRIEAGTQEYNSEFLNACADVLICTPAALLGWPPGPLHTIHTLCAKLPADELRRALRVLQALEPQFREPESPVNAEGDTDL